MDALHFEGDEAKAKADAKKHGVSFEEAKSIFLDDRAQMIQIRIIPLEKSALFCWATARL